VIFVIFYFTTTHYCRRNFARFLKVLSKYETSLSKLYEGREAFRRCKLLMIEVWGKEEIFCLLWFIFIFRD